MSVEEPSKLKITTTSAIALVITAVLLWGAGLITFMIKVRQDGMAGPAASAEGIVVLTGGAGRIQVGLDALAAGRGGRLLISGVNRSFSRETILEAIGTSPELAACCIDLGRTADDTQGNASEAAAWAKEHNFHSLLLVTSDFHMPRAEIETRRVLPDVKLVPLAVKSEPGIAAISLEYSKYLVSLSRLYTSHS